MIEGELSMITFDEAYACVMDAVIPMGREAVALEECMGRVLAEEVVSDLDMPPFNKSAMDGYACRKQDLGHALRVVEEIPAGYQPRRSVGENECAKIMTGAMVPEGADCVIMVEYVEEVSENTIRYLKESTKENICREAEDLRRGDKVLEKGALISPRQIAVLATVGHVNPMVATRPRVGVISTGNELVEPSEKASGPKIRNSNGWQLAAQVEEMGCLAKNYGIAEDTEEALNAVVSQAIAENDVLLLSGGVSMGDYDLVPGILRENGIELLFTKVAIKPGRPSTFGVGETTRCFALPGNPVSTFIQFEMLVKPALFKMMGHDYRPTVVKAKVQRDIRQKQADRLSIIPVKLVAADEVEPVDYHGSAHISAMCETDGFVIFPSMETLIKKGSVTDVRLL